MDGAILYHFVKENHDYTDATKETNLKVEYLTSGNIIMVSVVK